MICTVEPGLYFPDDCGVRTEDDVLVDVYKRQSSGISSEQMEL